MREPVRLPVAPPGASIGLFGGSFDPPHQGHVMVSDRAIRLLNLDRLWWLVSPGNPLKTAAPASRLAQRIATARRLVTDPRVTVTGLEGDLGTRYTVDLVRFLTRRFRKTRFVWVMGADGLAQLHRWRDWRDLANLIPIAVIDRPGGTFAPIASPAARALARHRIRERDAGRLALTNPPAWVFLHGPRLPVSSTEIRGKRHR